MRALYICGSINQTRMVHQVARQLPQFEFYLMPSGRHDSARRVAYLFQPRLDTETISDLLPHAVRDEQRGFLFRCARIFLFAIADRERLAGSTRNLAN